MMEKQERYLFLYLNTGNGHITPARILKKEIEAFCNAKIILLEGFGTKQHFAHAFFETGYHITSVLFPAVYSLFYECTRIPFFLNICKFFCAVATKHYLAKVIETEHITKVVCFHFAVASAAHWAVRKTNPRIPFIIDVTDPFSAHPAWFLERTADYIVHSQKLKDEMLQKYGMKEEQITLQPFIIDSRFNAKLTNSEHSEELNALKKANDILPDEKAILIAGGGEGLPGVISLIQYLCTYTSPKNVHILVVCGRNVPTRKIFECIGALNPHLKLHIFGFVSNMDELIKMSDCVITKAGASMVMEVLACKKPIIFSTYIHGQELGNVDFVISNKAGWFIQKPEHIFKKAFRLCSDEQYALKIAENLSRLSVSSQVPKTARFIEEYNGKKRH